MGKNDKKQNKILNPERGVIEDARPPSGHGMFHERHIGIVRRKNGGFCFFWDRSNIGITIANIGDEIDFELREELCFDIAIPTKLYDINVPSKIGVIVTPFDMDNINSTPKDYGYLIDTKTKMRVYYWNKNKFEVSLQDEVEYEYKKHKFKINNTSNDIELNIAIITNVKAGKNKSKSNKK